MPPKVDFVYFNAGEGHRAALAALESVIEQEARPWELRRVNLQELLDPIDILRRLTGVRIEDCYNMLLRKGWTRGTTPLMKLLHAVIRFYHPAEVRLLEEHWRRSPPELVVSLIPHFNRAIGEAWRRINPQGKLVTVLTDLADCPPHFWLERQPQYVVCGTARAARQARRTGIPQDHIFLVSGMILRPQFYEPVILDRERERRRLGLDPDRPTGMLLFGGQGSRVMMEIVRRLQPVRRELQLICLCGRNRELAAALRTFTSRFPLHVVEFTTEVPYYMRLADFFIGKPGPGSLSEAVAMGLPVIVERNAWTMPQERYNADWVLENRLGLVIRDFRRIREAVEELLAPERFEHFRAAVAGLENRAVFEVTRLLETILEKQAALRC